MADIIELDTHRGGAKPPAPAASHDVVRLDAAIAQVRAIEEKIQTVEGSACLLAMDAGDVLSPINTTIAYGKWGPFCKSCGLSLRSAQVYLQSAAARPQIEAENAQRAAHLPALPPLSIRAALELIGPKKPGSKPGSKTEPEIKPEPAEDFITIADVLAWLPTASPADRRKVAAGWRRTPRRRGRC